MTDARARDLARARVLVLALALVAALAVAVLVGCSTHNAAGGYVPACGQLPGMVGDDC
jgi:hypothetical protein